MIERFELVKVLFFLQNSGSDGGNSLLGDADLRMRLGRLARAQQAAQDRRTFASLSLSSIFLSSLRLDEVM